MPKRSDDLELDFLLVAEGIAYHVPDGVLSGHTEPYTEAARRIRSALAAERDLLRRMAEAGKDVDYLAVQVMEYGDAAYNALQNALARFRAVLREYEEGSDGR